MTRIAHLSDLHFGAHDPALIAPLLAAVAATRPDLVVVSGDLAHRGTAAQFAQARAFLAALPAPWLCVPGNHDVPHFNPLLRLSDPWRRWRRAAGVQTQPDWQDRGAVVAGLCTADPRAWKRGRLGPQALTRLSGAFAQAGARARVAVMHHPLEHAALNLDRLMHGAAETLAGLPATGAQVVLSGHVHVSFTGPFAAAPGVLFVQAGTALSTRRRGEANAFTLLDLARDRAQICVYHAGPTGFIAGLTADYARVESGWFQREMIDAQA